MSDQIYEAQAYEIAKMARSISALEAENDKLREDNDCLIQAVEDLHDVILEDKLVQLENENDKLREYGKLLHDHIKECCDYCGECGTCDVDALTRELGIEVK